MLTSALLFAAIGCASGQQNESDGSYDRSVYILPGTELSDDLRRTPVPPGYGAPDGQLFIDDARLFDGTGADIRTVDILIDGKTISKIEPALQAPSDARVIDARGRTVMPGLIDLHTHVTYVEQFGLPNVLSDLSQADAALRGAERLRIYVENGITSVRDVASHGMAPFILKDWITEGRIAGPRLFSSGQLITGEGGHGTEGFVFATAPTDPGGAIRQAAGADDWIAAVREQFKRGADLIKIGSHYSEDEVQAAVQEAHRLGLKVVVDSETFFTRMAVEAGADVIEHPLPRSDDTIAQMAERGVASVPTFIPYQIIINGSGGYFGSTSRRFTLSEELMFAHVEKMRDAGVKLGVGTDLIVDWIKFMPDAYIKELKNFERLEYTPPEALIAATKTNSEILGMDDRLGTIEVGKLADIIFVEGRPDENLDDLRNVTTVIVGGRLIVDDDQVVFPPPFEPAPLPF